MGGAAEVNGPPHLVWAGRGDPNSVLALFNDRERPCFSSIDQQIDP